MTEEQAERIIGLLTEIRDEHRRFVQLMQEPGPAPVHTHEPADGGSPAAPFWLCKCGYVHDDERVGV